MTIFSLQASGGFYSFGDFSAGMVNCTEQPKLGAPFNVTLDIGSKIQIPISGYIKAILINSMHKAQIKNITCVSRLGEKE
jgi:hypothetical protein